MLIVNEPREGTSITPLLELPIKAIDFFKLYINNTSYERNDDLILNYIGGNKRILVKQIELLFNYTKNKHHNQYIEEYNKLYNNINIEQRKSNDKMEK